MGQRFHAKNSLGAIGSPFQHEFVWRYERLETSLTATSQILARVVVGKVVDMNRLTKIFDGTPVHPEIPGWNCVAWVKEALVSALNDEKALGTAVSDWDSARDTMMKYIAEKRAAHRFDGQAGFDPNTVPTWDMLAGKELIA